MPRYFLKEMDIIPEVFFSDTRYSGKHDLTAYWVRDGLV
jgi:ABC-type phosphate/phosphonate transport system substrate-binding protein